MDVIDDLLDFVETGAACGWLAAVEQQIGHLRLRVIAIKILSRLKSQHRFPKIRPLELNLSYPWCADLQDHLMGQPKFAALFVVSEGAMDFHGSISDDVRREIRARANERYNPPLRTTM